MNSYSTLLISIAFAVAAFAVVLAQAPPPQEKMAWSTFDSGVERAKTSNKKILVDVYTDWCGWCKRMDADIYTDGKVKEYLEKNFISIKLNAESSTTLNYQGRSYTEAQLAAAFGVNGYPSTIFLRSSGEPITLLPGYVEAPMFLNVLSFIAENHYETKQFRQYLDEKGIKQ